MIRFKDVTHVVFWFPMRWGLCLAGQSAVLQTTMTVRVR